MFAQDHPLEIYVQTGHSSIVLSVAFSPDDKSIATGGADNTVRLWDVETGREIRTFIGHSGDVGSLCFSPDGECLVTASNDGTACLWRVATGEKIRTFDRHLNFVTSVAFSPDSKYIITGSRDKTIILWDIESGDVLHRFNGHSDYVTSVAFSPDGKYILTGSYDCSARLWKVSSGEEIRAFKGITSGLLGKFRGGLLEGLFKGHYSYITSVDFSPDGKYVVTAGHDKIIRLWSAKSGEQLRTFRSHSKTTPNEGFTSVAFSSDGQYIVAGSLDKTALLWDLGKRREIRTFRGHADAVTSAAFSYDGNYIVSGSGSLLNRLDRTAKLWDVATGKEIQTFSGHPRYGNIVSFSPDGKEIITDYGDNLTKIWDIERESKVRNVDQDFKTTEQVNVNPIFDYMIAIDSSDTVRIWDVADGNIVKIKAEGSHRITATSISSDNRYLVTGSLDYTAKLWDVLTGADIRTFFGHNGEVFSVKFSPDSKYIVSGSLDNTARLWEVETGREILIMGGHSYTVSSVDFSPDCRLIVTGSVDGISSLWDVKSGRELVKLIPIDDKDWAIATPEGFFEASEGAKRCVYFVQDRRTYDLDQFLEDFYRPNLLELITKPGRTKLPNINVTETIRRSPPPAVQIIAPKVGERLQRKNIEVEVRVTDEGGGIDEVKLMHNGKRKSFDSWRNQRNSQENENSIVCTFAVSLVGGDNSITTSAFSKGRIESLKDKVNILLKEGARNRSYLFVLIIGINDYANDNIDLKYARTSAREFENFINNMKQNLFEKIEVTTLYDFEATKLSVFSVLDNIAEIAEAEDMILVYFAGRGTIVDDEYYLVTSENMDIEDPRNLERNAINIAALKEKFQNIWALKQLLIIDACQPNRSVTPAFLRDAVAERAMARLSESTGVKILASAGIEHTNEEFLKLGNGIFTYALLEGLKGEADIDSSDGEVTIFELRSYLDNRIPNLTKEYRGTSHYPNTYVKEYDFPLILK